METLHGSHSQDLDSAVLAGKGSRSRGVSMNRWMRLAAKSNSGNHKLPANDTAKAAADALAHLLKGVRKHA